MNHAVVVDFSRHMDRVLEVNEEERWARVQPGVVQDNLNAHVGGRGLLFGPDTSTSSRATLGGMIGNNSGGAHSIAYGLTVEHVIELTAILADGTRARFGEVTPEAFAAKARQPGLEGQIYREVARIRDQYADDIRGRYPKYWRRVCGYNLDELIAPRPLNMARLVVGSEGTLLTVVEARVRLVPRPKATALDVLHFHDIQEALECSQAILETGPYAVELTDKMILDLARGNLEHAKRMAFVRGDPAAILMVEYAGETAAEVRGKVEALEALRARDRFAYASHVAGDGAEQQSIWKLRKAGLGLLFGLKGEAKPIAFIEDTAVDPKHLPAFVPRFREIMARHGAEGAYYGHCSVGCLHIRPVINLKTPRGLEQVRAMADEVCDLVLEFGGAFSSEHGDGRARSPFLERIYGPTVFKAFRELKQAFDPRNLMNPGNLVDSPGLTQHLRYGPQYRTWEPRTLLDFSERGGFAGAVEMCNGVGVCRKTLEGTMCPSYMATKDETHTTRGRANALRAVLSGKVPPAEFTGQRLYEVMDLCLECKACKSECPANVDMAKMKYEFLYHYHRANGLPLRNRLFGHISALSAVGSRLAATLELDRARRPQSPAHGARGGHRPPAAAPRLRPRDLHGLVRQAPPRRRRRRAARSCSSTTPSSATIPPRLAAPPSSCWKPAAIASTSWTASAAAGRSSPRACSTRRASMRDGTWRSWPRWWRAGCRWSGSSRPACSPCATSTWSWCRAPRRVRWRGRAFSWTSSSCASARGASRSFRDGRGRALLHGHCHQKALVGTGSTVQRPPVGRLRCGRGGLRLLRHGRVVRIRARALRHLGDPWQPPARPRGEGGGGDTEVVAPGHLLPAADRASDRTASPAPGRGHPRGARPLTSNTRHRFDVLCTALSQLGPPGERAQGEGSAGSTNLHGRRATEHW